MAIPPVTPAVDQYVGTLVGESTSREFRLAVAHETIREQDIIAVDAELRRPDGNGLSEQLRVWAKVQRIERVNPLFPTEAGHELAETHTDPFDTVLSLHREMVTAVCQVLGAESRGDNQGGKLAPTPTPASARLSPRPASPSRPTKGTFVSRSVWPPSFYSESAGRGKA
jgi:uncharacterized protein